MAALDFGVGEPSAMTPSVILRHVPREETASVLSINQIVRTVGFSVSSALTGLLLAAITASSSLVPSEGGYKVAAVCVFPPLALVVVAMLSGKTTTGPYGHGG
jgi:hypothetical protein